MREEIDYKELSIYDFINLIDKDLNALNNIVLDYYIDLKKGLELCILMGYVFDHFQQLTQKYSKKPFISINKEISKISLKNMSFFVIEFLVPALTPLCFIGILITFLQFKQLLSDYKSQDKQIHQRILELTNIFENNVYLVFSRLYVLYTGYNLPTDDQIKESIGNKTLNACGLILNAMENKCCLPVPEYTEDFAAHILRNELNSDEENLSILMAEFKEKNANFLTRKHP